MQIVQLIAVPSQTVAVILNSQNCTINVYQKSTGLYLDLLVNDIALLTCVQCLNGNLIVRDEYLGFLGDLFFADMQGVNDPTFDGIGKRYFLAYAFPAELAL